MPVPIFARMLRGGIVIESGRRIDEEGDRAVYASPAIFTS